VNGEMLPLEKIAPSPTYKNGAGMFYCFGELLRAIF